MAITVTIATTGATRTTATTATVVIIASIDWPSLNVRWSTLYSHDGYNSRNICDSHDTHDSCNSQDSYNRHNGHDGYSGYDDHTSDNYVLNYSLDGPNGPKSGSAVCAVSKARLQYPKCLWIHVYSGHRFCGCQRDYGLLGEGELYSQEKTLWGSYMARRLHGEEATWWRDYMVIVKGLYSKKTI